MEIKTKGDKNKHKKQYTIPEKCPACNRRYSYLKQSRASMNIEQLREQHKKEIEELKSLCKHVKWSDWMDEWWAPGHSTGRQVKICNRCGEIMDCVWNCRSCGTELQGTKLDFKWNTLWEDHDPSLSNMPYCDECFPAAKKEREEQDEKFRRYKELKSLSDGEVKQLEERVQEKDVD